MKPTAAVHRAAGSWSLIALAAVLAFACAGPGDGGRHTGDTSLAARVFQLAGVADHVRGLSEALVDAARVRALDLDAEGADRLIERAHSVAETPTLIAAAETLFAERSDGRAFLVPAHAFLISATGRRMRALEEQAETELDDAAFSGFIDGLFGAPVPVERTALLERLGVATRGAEIAADTEAIAARVIVRALEQDGLAPASAPTLAAALAEIDRRSVRTAERLRVQSIVWLQYVYRDASDEELAEYVAFAESPTGIALVDTTRWTVGELEPWLDDRMAARSDAPALR